MSCFLPLGAMLLQQQREVAIETFSPSPLYFRAISSSSSYPECEESSSLARWHAARGKPSPPPSEKGRRRGEEGGGTEGRTGGPFPVVDVDADVTDFAIMTPLECTSES